MHQFCLKGSTARAFISQRGRPPRFSRHFSLITSSINVGPPRIEQHVEGDKRPMSLSIGNQSRRKLLNFLFAIGEHTASIGYTADLSLL